MPHVVSLPVGVPAPRQMRPPPVADIAFAESIAMCFAKDAMTVARENARETVTAAIRARTGGGGAAASGR